jgi:N-acetylmuramoyl-L-alanine amidase
MSNDGTSTLAIPAETPWDADDRPIDWQGHVYGLVVHTTGSGLPESARQQGIYHTVRAVQYYSQSHGCHYVNGWAGMAGGDLIQMANEREQAIGVGMSSEDPKEDQRRSVESGNWEADLPAVVVQHWRERWPDRENPLDLLPGTKTANSCYIHVECVPCVYHFNGPLVTDAPPMREGLRFTQAQCDTIAELAVDIATRNGWPTDEQWWRTPRLLGHEDLTPIARCDPNGGWDPGALRDKPYFDWDYVYARIEELVSGGGGVPAEPTPTEDTSDVFAPLGADAEQFLTLATSGDHAAAVALAIDVGISEVDELTNLLFFAFHPEMNGRRIQAHETELADEWLRLRDDVVEPEVASRSGG